METSRLLIKPMKESDENAFVSGIADRKLRVSYGFPADMDVSALSKVFHHFCKLPRAYSIVEKKTNSMIGFLLDVDPELPEDISKTLPKKGRTLAFAIFPPYQRQGYMEETLKVYVSSQLQNNGAAYIHCGHFMDNDPSRCLLQKIGFTEYSRHSFKDRIIIDQIIPGKSDINQSIEHLTDRIVHILDNDVHSIWLYGSAVLDDFRLGWSDIDLLVLSNNPITEQQAGQLVGLRQTMLEAEPDNLYYRSFEGIIADKNEYLSGSFSRLVYWGTSGQRNTDRYRQDVFSAYELAKYGKSIYGESDRSIFVEPSAAELRSAVKQHYESIRQYAIQTDEKLYSCGWLLDIARCIYTLRHNDVIAKTQAGRWALSEHIFPDEAPLKKALEIRQNPAAFKDKEDVKQWLMGLGPVVQQYADVLEHEINHSLLIRRMTESDLEPLYKLLSDPEVMRFLEPPYTRERASAFHQMGLSENPLVYAVEADGAFIGYVIYHPYEEDSIEIGWVLLPEYWRRGYASELTRQMIDKASKENKTLVIECDPQQEVTKHIAQKFGFTRAGSRDGLDVYERNITIKKMETDDEIRGKAYVHWQSWHEVYPGMVSQDYLDRFTLEKAEKMAFSWGGDHLIIAKAGDRVIGFVGYGDRGDEAPETGEIFALYILSEYYGTGVGKHLMDAGLEQLKGYPQICLWVLKENKRAIRFYEKCGFHPDGQEMFSKNVEAPEIRMVRDK